MNKIKLPKVIAVGFTIAIMILSTFGPVLVNNFSRGLTFTNNRSVTEVFPIVVMFGSSQEEMAAKYQILDNFPNSVVIDFSDVEQIYLKSSPIIYIGHSSTEGIAYGNQMIGWDKISDVIENSISNDHYILGCDSDVINTLVSDTQKNVLSFGFKIDALLGISYISIRIAMSKNVKTESVINIYRQYVQRSNELRNDPSLALLMNPRLLEPGLGGQPSYPACFTSSPTYIVDQSGPKETQINTINFFLLLASWVFLGTAMYLGNALVSAILAMGIMTVELTATMYNFLKYINGDETFAAFAGAFLLDLGAALLIIIYATIAIVSAPVAALASAILGTEVAAMSLSGGVTTVITILSLIGSTIWWISGTLSDLSDADDCASMPDAIENLF